jgi:hypothetical protein
MRGSARPHEVELLADELNRLVGWGVEPKRLATKPVLSELAEVDGSLSCTTAGCIILRLIRESINSYDGSREFRGREYEVRALQRAFTLLLAVEQANLSAPARYRRVAKLLGLDYSYGTWRRNPRYQRGLLTLLAEWMTDRHQT